MPHDDPDPQDPMMFVGVELPGDVSQTREMAWATAEEFARTGLSHGKILGLFRSPLYAATHRAWVALGDEEIVSIVDEAARAWGSARVRVRDGSPSTAPLVQITLPEKEA